VKNSKSKVGDIKLLIDAGGAKPSPPVGPAFGQRGLNIMDFCNRFNATCKEMGIEPGIPTPVVVTYYQDKTFTMVLKKPPVSVLIKRKLKLAKAAKKAGTEFVGTINVEQIKEIAQMKMADMGVESEEAAVEMVKGTCRSMGVKVAG
jgi:large subunit ribosomal protein L11